MGCFQGFESESRLNVCGAHYTFGLARVDVDLDTFIRGNLDSPSFITPCMRLDCLLQMSLLSIDIVLMDILDIRDFYSIRELT